MKNLRLHIILLFVCFTVLVKAQQTPLYSQYMMNRYAMNPALTGTYEYFKVASNYRHQWVGITDAPRTYILSVHGPHKYKNFGLGGMIFSDVTGPTSRTGLALSYAYHMRVGLKQKVSLGLSGGILQYKLDGTKVTLLDPGDLVLTNTLMSTLVPDFGFGAYWFEDDKFYLGISTPQFIQNRLQFFDNSTQTLSRLKAHFLINGGYNFTINDVFDLEASGLIKYVWPVIPQLDLGLKGTYNKTIFLGLVYRTQDAYSVILGYNTPDQRFSFGYSYDMIYTNLANHTSGTHELMIVARFGKIKSAAAAGGSRRKKSKLERLQEKLKELDKQEEAIDEELGDQDDGGMDYYDNKDEDQQKERSQEETDPKANLRKELADLESRDRSLRQKVRDLREEAKNGGYSSPSDSGFPKRKEYLDALDEIKDIYKRKQELDKLLDD